MEPEAGQSVFVPLLITYELIEFLENEKTGCDPGSSDAVEIADELIVTSETVLWVVFGTIVDCLFPSHAIQEAPGPTSRFPTFVSPLTLMNVTMSWAPEGFLLRTAA
jgi:hypothetical protein